jgi:hypothetical protein
MTTRRMLTRSMAQRDAAIKRAHECVRSGRIVDYEDYKEEVTALADELGVDLVALHVVTS